MSEEECGIFCDGSCSPNPGEGGWAIIRVVKNTVVYSNGGHANSTTNNRMELEALKEALKIAQPDDIIYTDSKLSENTVNLWMKSWKKRNWSKADGNPPENLDLIKKIYDLKQEWHTVKWIKAHATHKWNNHVDRLANAHRLGDTDAM